MILSESPSLIFHRQDHHEHLTVLTKQLLYEENLPASWTDIIISTVDRVSLIVRPAVKENCDDMDIRKYVHIKKVQSNISTINYKRDTGSTIQFNLFCVIWPSAQNTYNSIYQYMSDTRHWTKNCLRTIQLFKFLIFMDFFNMWLRLFPLQISFIQIKDLTWVVILYKLLSNELNNIFLDVFDKSFIEMALNVRLFLS